jgi:hypothetical protein
MFETLTKRLARPDVSEVPAIPDAVDQARERLTQFEQAEARLRADLAREEGLYEEATEQLTQWRVEAALAGIERTADAETAEVGQRAMALQSIRQALSRVEVDRKAAEQHLERVQVKANIDALAVLSAELSQAIARLSDVGEPLRQHIEAMAIMSGRFRARRQSVSADAMRLQLPMPRLVDSGAAWDVVQRLLNDLRRGYGEWISAGERGEGTSVGINP